MQLPPEVLDTSEPFDPEQLDAVINDEGHPELTEDEVTSILGWTPPDIERADWAGRKWVAAASEADEVKRIAAEQIARIESWRDGELARVNRRLSWFAQVLERFAVGRRIASGTATTKLPSVTVSTRQVNAGVDVDDEAAVIDWLETNRPTEAEVAVKVTKKLLKSSIPTDLTEMIVPIEMPDGSTTARFIDRRTGEPVPGLVPRQPRLSASVKPNTVGGR